MAKKPTPKRGTGRGRKRKARATIAPPPKMEEMDENESGAAGSDTGADPVSRLKKQGGGRWQKGQSGNPNGRPPGTVSERTRLLELLLDDEAEGVVNAMVSKALKGSTEAGKILIPLMVPARKSRWREPFELGPVNSVADAIAAQSRVLAALSAGQIEDDQAAALSAGLDRFASLSRVDMLERQLAEMREAIQSLQQKAGIAPSGPRPVPSVPPRITPTHEGGSA